MYQSTHWVPSILKNVFLTQKKYLESKLKLGAHVPCGVRAALACVGVYVCVHVCVHVCVPYSLLEFSLDIAGRIFFFRAIN